MKKEIDEKLREKTNKQSKAIEDLSQQNEDLREMIAQQRKTIEELKTQVIDNEVRSKEAVQMSNYNEQYSRKFNIKVMNCPEEKGENLTDLFIHDIVKDKLKVDIKPSDIQAIHRIPGKKGQHNPILVKMVNSEVKTRVMVKKKSLPKKGINLVDDVTKYNMGLITRLRECKDLDSVWYFNCSVYGKTVAGTKVKFNIFDDINQKLKGKI